MELTLLAIDTSKHVFTLHGVDANGKAALRRELRRGQMEPFFGKLPPTEIALEACDGSHHWGRELGKLGHRVRLRPPQHVKPFVKHGKNNRIDAEAIAEAADATGQRRARSCRGVRCDRRERDHQCGQAAGTHRR